MERKFTGYRVWLVLVMGIVLAMMLSVKAQAASFTKKTVEGTGALSFQDDFDGDGKADVLQITTSGKYTYYFTEITVKLNGKTVLTKKMSSSGILLQAASFCCSGSKQYLYLGTSRENYDVTGSAIYTYNAATGKLKTVLPFKSFYNGYSYSKIGKAMHWGITVTGATDSGITFSYYMQPVELGGLSYKVIFAYKNGSFKLKSSSFGSIKVTGHSGTTYKTARTLTFYSKAGGTSRRFVLTKGKKAKLKKMCLKSTGLYAQFQYGGKTGWIKVGHTYSSLKPTYTSNGYCSSYFTGIRLAG